MTLGANYATLAEIRTRVGITDAANTTHDSELTAALDSASRGIEKVCNRQFNDAGSATARVFYPDNDRFATIDDFISLTSVKTDPGNTGTYSETWAAADYQSEPLNGVVDGETGWPFWHLRAVLNRRFPCVYYDQRAPLEVTARWGWSAVPAPVKQGCLILAEEIYKLRDSPFGVGGYSQFGIVRARENPMVWARVGPYARDLLLVG